MTGEIINTAFHLICKMEEDIEEAHVISDGIGVLATEVLCDRRAGLPGANERAWPMA
jgi:hypothetical protein